MGDKKSGPKTATHLSMSHGAPSSRRRLQQNCESTGSRSSLGLPEMLPHPRQYLFFALLQVFPFALDGKTSLSVAVSISKGPADPQDIRWHRVPGTARCFRCIDFYQHLTPFIYEKYLAPKCDCFEGTVSGNECVQKVNRILCTHTPGTARLHMGLCLGME